MASTPPGFEPSEYVSGIALDVLDEFYMRVLELRLVLEEVLAWEADLNFDELECLLWEVQQGLRDAHAAASLVRQRAALDESWGRDCCTIR
ncbi:hypothetical protein [Mycobacterium sp. DL440]|uniref:hypothetical protein n=1 Tax=Mycobacterium sp. DL440 TaxID=2675523 RepID=UPI001424803F|nr:hypothetical protein [Mycobacterium sp. DL440]